MTRWMGLRTSDDVISMEAIVHAWCIFAWYRPRYYWTDHIFPFAY